MTIPMFLTLHTKIVPEALAESKVRYSLINVAMIL
jgi:hypothetical protein